MAKTSQEVAVDALQQMLEEARARVAWLESCIANLKEFRPDVVLPDLPKATHSNHNSHTVRPGQYRLLKVGAALMTYLEEHGEVQVSKLVADLTLGGVEMLVRQKSQGERMRRMRITIGNNKRKLVYDEQHDTVRLKGQAKAANQDGLVDKMLSLAAQRAAQ